ncbi:GNAT family N-acetyltransferase [Vagococcus lutrae]|uniref:N-acetyltransferase domain-containing protein n=2 Tax=Vagococcus lutrae TaxID=81947 RepID=V6Q762_9ENTE|nr:GNAT family N-acetyltransferase [Vagococcus lutrae]EST90510.1 hypothetical protein T233_00254 [Vagococcus lutrae LBD1]MCO7150913.1 GNAT family N-acetyltransferase [Vagococcus lutrae]MDT2800730.1 GNAT family N-acetyltransferase [Vagococcus lutrae]MDT2805420.1 GNAT family N-acetyltransferase [Vagococcus lutrae]MDT2807173.1 GNAT family N-acetyltransferase [Vagococcus lutrae]
MAIKMKTIQWQSKEYYEGIALRNQHLNQPSGLTLITDAPIQEELAIHLAAIIDQRVVGTLFLDNTDRENTAQIKQVAVSDAYRGMKIGQSLMAYAELIARQQGYEEIFLTARESAWLFYEKLGYESSGNTFIKSQGLILKPYIKRLQ